MMNYAYVAAFTGNIINFISGTALTWSSPELAKFNDTTKNPFDSIPSGEDTSWMIALTPLGAVFGPFAFGYCADKFGRKLTLLSLGVPYLVSFLLMTFCKVIAAFDVARFLIGVAIGGSFAVMPMYIGEISQDSNRGALSAAMNCFLCLGFVFSYSLGPYVSDTALNATLAVFPCLFLVSVFLFAPESPHYYVMKKDTVKALASLKKLRGDTDVNLDKELNAIETAVDDASKGHFLDLFRSKGVFKALIISVSLVAFEQFSGINAVLFYAQDIFKASNASLQPEICSIIIGVTQFTTSLVTPFLTDRLGRKPLLIFSAAGMIISEVPLGIYFILKNNQTDVSSASFLPILCLVAYILSYNAGFGPLPWTIMGETFPPHVKSFAVSTTAAVCWFLGFLIAKFFNSMSDAVGIGVSFLIFAGFCVAALLFSIFYLMETKGKSFKEIQDVLEE